MRSDIEKIADLREALAMLQAGNGSTSQQPTAVLITGNPALIQDNPQAEAFYAQIESYLQAQGWQVSRDPGEPYTSPPPADLWIGHSRGVDRLRFAPKGTRTISLGAPGGINHPKDTAMEPGDTPTEYHYMFTEEMQQAFDGAWKDVSPTPDDDNILEELLRAKKESDRGNYGAKHEILRNLIVAHPEQFILDSEEKGIYGITHIPSGFQIHMLQKASPAELARPLYHGSPLGDIKQLDPRTHKLSDRPVVFATPHEELALSMSLPASDEELAMGFEENTTTGARNFYIDELQPGKLELLNKPSFLYDLHPSTFSEEGLHPNLMREERISYDPATPFRAPRAFKSALQELRDRGVRIRAYDDVPSEMWLDKAGGAISVLSGKEHDLLNAVMHDPDFIKRAARDWSVGVGGGVKDITEEDVHLALEEIERRHGYPHPPNTSVTLGKTRPFHSLRRSFRRGSMTPSSFSDIVPAFKRQLGGLANWAVGGAEAFGPHFSPFSNMVRFGKGKMFRGEGFPSTLAHEIRHYRQHLAENESLEDEELASTYGTMLPGRGTRMGLFKTMQNELPNAKMDDYLADWMAIEIDSNIAGRQGLDPQVFRREGDQEVLPQASYFMNVAGTLDSMRDTSHPDDAMLRKMVPPSNPGWKKAITAAWLSGDPKARWAAIKGGLMHGVDRLNATYPADYARWRASYPEAVDYETAGEWWDAIEDWESRHPLSPVSFTRDDKMVWTRSDTTIPELSRHVLTLEYQRRLAIRANLKKAASSVLSSDISRGNPTWRGILAGTPGENIAQNYRSPGEYFSGLKDSFFRRPSEAPLYDPKQTLGANVRNFFMVPNERINQARRERRSFDAIRAEQNRMEAYDDRNAMFAAATAGATASSQDSPWGKMKVGPSTPPGLYSSLGGWTPGWLHPPQSVSSVLEHMIATNPDKYRLESTKGPVSTYAGPGGVRVSTGFNPGSPVDIHTQHPNWSEWVDAMNLESGRAARSG